MVAGTTLRVAFFGTPAFAVPTLDALLDSPHVVVGVVTQPDRPRGRGQKLTDAPVKARAVAAGLPILQPERLRDTEFLAQFTAWKADLGVVAAYGRILSDALLALPRLGMINVHASLLPRYRGAAPVHRAVIAGEQETGVTIMRVVKALDAGPMISSVRRAIGPDETSDEVERDSCDSRRVAARGDRRSDGARTGRRNAAGRCARDLRSPSDEARGRDRLVGSAQRIHNMVRGLHPWPHAFTFHDGRRLIVRRTSAAVSAAGELPVAPAGTIIAAEGRRADRRKPARDRSASPKCKRKASVRWRRASSWRVTA